MARLKRESTALLRDQTEEAEFDNPIHDLRMMIRRNDALVNKNDAATSRVKRYDLLSPRVREASTFATLIPLEVSTHQTLFFLKSS